MDWLVLTAGRRRGWAALALGLLLLAAGPRDLAAQEAPPEGRPAADGLAGRLLVAAPHLSDPNFSHAVIYVLRHGPSGALGLVINRPMGEVPLSRLLGLLHGSGAADGDGGGGGAAETEEASLQVYSGGPVEPYRPFTLHSRDVMPEHSVAVDDDTAFNVEDEILKALADDDYEVPKSMIFVLGYSGWAAGQLESELDRGDWYVVASDPALVFSAEPGQTWERAVALFSTEL